MELPMSFNEVGQKRSTIREIFEYGKTRIAQVGTENVYDFSIGNPSPVRLCSCGR